jgi:hypothetical protein
MTWIDISCDIIGVAVRETFGIDVQEIARL